MFSNLVQDVDTLRMIAQIVGVIGVAAVGFVWGWAERDKQNRNRRRP